MKKKFLLMMMLSLLFTAMGTSVLNAQVAKVGNTEYSTLAEAVAEATEGETITMLADAAEDATIPAGVTFNGNGKAVGNITAAGTITFNGHTMATSFSVEYTNTTINIVEGACLEIIGAGRMVIGHGCTFNITGTITDAKTANVAELTRSLIMPGASFTGAGVTFNVTNAYISAPSSYCSSSKSASGTFDFNITNSIWESAGKLAFESQSTAATVNFDLVESVLNTGSHLVFGVSRGEVVIDKSNVNVGTSRQLENRSTMTIKNGSVVNGAVATSSNAINPGTIIVENATYAVTGEFSGAAEGTGTLVIKKGANVSVGSIEAGANVVVDAEGMAAGDEINFTADLSKFTGTLSVINNDNLEASIVDGKIVLVVKPVAKIGDVEYATLEAAFAAATEGQTITLLADATPTLTSQRAITKAAVIDLGGKTLTLTEDDLYFGTTTFQNGNIVVDPSVKPSTAMFWMFENQTLTFDNVKLTATGVTGTYLIGLDGNNSDLNIINGSEIIIENTTALDLDVICVNASTGNDIVVEDSKVNVTNLDGRVFFRGNYTVKDSEVNLDGITKAGFRIEAGQTLSIEGTSVVNITGEPRDGGIHLTDLTATYTKAETATVNATVNEPKVAKVGENTYRTLALAVAAVEDGGTITLIANETFTENNRYNNGGWWDGLGYSGDKSFTINLDNFTISQDGALNDYLMWFKNDGAKANTITLKNGTLDAGTTAYSALATASSNAQKITVNLENIKVINNYDNGSTVKVRGGAELNVKDGTVITGKDSYLGIECIASTANIYDGAEIYMNGTSSYNGCLAGVGGNGTINVYGGEGQSKSGGFIAMTSGGTINVEGGEWTANTDGTYANSNKSVLVAQSDKQYNAGAGNSIVNVTGGTFKGGYNCYGNAAGDAQINIKGGNFNANPTSYVAEDYIAVENNGVWNVTKAAAKIGEQKFATLQAALNAAAQTEELTTIQLLAGTHTFGNVKFPATLKNVTIVGADNKATIIKGSKLYSADGNAVTYKGITFDGIVFDNSSILFTGARSGEVIYEDWTIKNCDFSDLQSTDGIAAIHFNLAADETIKNFTFENNTITNVTSPSNTASGLRLNYVTGNVVIKDNETNNVAFNAVQIINSEVDNFTFEGNILRSNGSSLANLYNVTGENIVITKNQFLANEDQESVSNIAYADVSGNYWGGGAPTDLPEGVVYSSYYTTVESDGTLGGLVELPQGNDFTGYTRGDAIWGEVWGNAKDSFVVKVLDANGNEMGTTSLNNIGGIIDGDVTVTWTLKLDAASNTDEYWTMNWTTAPTINNMPAKVELWVDGVKVSGGPVVLNAPDNLSMIYAAVTDNTGKILAYHTNVQEAIKAAAAVTGGARTTTAGTVEFLADVTVDKWIMFSETLSIGNGQIITIEKIEGLTIDGNNHKLTINSIESAGNGNRLFYDATNLNIKDLTINYGEGVAGGIGLKSGTISNVNFNGGVSAIYPGAGEVIITDCTFKTSGHCIYFEEERDNLVVTNNTFELPADANVILLRGDVTFTGNNVKSGRTVNVVSGSPVVTGNNFNDVRFKVYNAASATISENTINNLVFNETDVPTESTFTNNTLSPEAQAAIDALPAIAGEGTEANPYLINDVDDLVWLQEKVDELAQDGSTQFAGKYFKLTNDIDLNGINWNPIGTMSADHGSFKGVFDGGDHTISNLYVEQAGNGIGLFARTTGNAVIKNLKLNNVTVESTDNSNYVGGLVGNAYASTKIENVHVSGNVYISGRGYIGGIAGHGYVVMDNVSVDATGDGHGNTKGLITSTFWCAGGVLGYAGEGATNIMNAHVENVVVTSAAGGLGAIVGMAEDNNGTQPISGSNLSAENVEIKTYIGAYGDSYANHALGYLYGGNPTSILTGDLSVEEVTIETSTGEIPEVNDAVAKIGNSIYFNLKAALNAAVENETITLLRDIKIAEKTVIDNRTLTIDGNGKTLTYTGTDRAIDVPNDANANIDVTIKNLDVVATTANRGINYNDNGTLNVDNVTVTIGENVDGYAINFPGMADNAQVTIKDSKLTSRNPLNIWGENMVINVYDSEITSVDGSDTYNYAAIQLNNDNYGNVANGTVVNVYGGVLTATDEKGEPSNVVANATETGVVNISDETVVTGKVLDYVANIGGVYLGSLQAAVNAIEKYGYNSPIVIMKSFATSETATVKNGLNVTIDLNGKTITVTDETEKNFEAIKNQGTLTIKDSSADKTGKITVTATTNSGWNRYSAVIANTVGGKLTVDGGTLEHLGGTDMAYGIDNLTNGKGTYAETVINGGTIKSTYRGIRQFLNGTEAQNILTVNGGTIEGANNSIWMQDPNTYANSGALTVTEAAKLFGDVKLSVTAGSTEWPVEVSIAAVALQGESTVLTANLPVGVDVQNINGTYGNVNVVAQIGDVKYQTLADAATAAQSGETIQLIWAEGNDPISMAATFVGDKTVTITGTADVDWSKGWFFVGRGGEGDGHVIFDNANLTSTSVGSNSGLGLNVSCKKEGESTTNDGEVEIINSNIQLDYLIGKGNIKLDNSKLEVYEGFAVGACPASETGGVQRTVTMDITNGSNVIVDNHNGQGLGHESNGIMNIDATSTFETKRSFLITANGTMNNAGTVTINGTLTNNGTIKLTDVALTGMTIDGTGTTYFYNTVNFYGNNNITTDINGSPFELIVNEDATLLISRFVLGYDRAITVYGNIEDAHNLTAEQIASMTPSLKFNSTSGVSVGGTATGRLTAKDAYLEFGSSSWKNSHAEHTWSFENCYVSATSFGNNNEPGAVTSTWNVTFDNSVLAAKNYIKNGKGVTYNFTNGSVATTGSLRIDGTLNVDANSSVTTTGQQNNVQNAVDEHGGINGTINIDGTLTIGSNSATQLEVLDGEVNVTETGNIILLDNNTLTLDADSEMRSCGNITGAITAAEGADVEITGGTYTMDVNEWCHEYYDAIPNGDGTWTVEQVMYALVRDLQEGWSWFSSFINIDGEAGLTKIKDALGENGVQVKDAYSGSFIQYTSASGWKGLLNEASSKAVYSIKTINDGDDIPEISVKDFTIKGAKVDPSLLENTVYINKGWNYIAYPLDQVAGLDVLSFTPAEGDVIKSKESSSMYWGGGWISNIDMTPGEGYMYKSNDNATKSFNFAYPTRSAVDASISNNVTNDYYWSVNAHKYPSNMTIVAMLNIDNELVKDSYEIAAFANGECRGRAQSVYVESLDTYVLVLTVHGEDVENITFKYYDVNSGAEYELSNIMVYSNDAIVGSVDEPYMFNLDILNVDEASINEVNVYPNPTTTNAEIDLNATCDKVEVFNALGVKVAEYSNVDSIDALETAGVYVIRVTIDGNARNCRLIVK